MKAKHNRSTILVEAESKKQKDWVPQANMRLGKFPGFSTNNFNREEIYIKAYNTSTPLYEPFVFYYKDHN